MEKEQTKLETVKEILKNPLHLQLIGAGFLAQKFALEADELEKKLSEAKLETAKAIKLCKEKSGQSDDITK